MLLIYGFDTNMYDMIRLFLPKFKPSLYDRRPINCDQTARGMSSCPKQDYHTQHDMIELPSGAKELNCASVDCGMTV